MEKPWRRATLPTMQWACLLCAVPWLISGCATAPPPADPIGALRARASSDLSCPQALLQITPLGDETFGETRQPLYQSVEGCSMHVSYIATSAGYVMKSGSRPPPAMAPDHVDVR
jgi:hypothetical protein